VLDSLSEEVLQDRKSRRFYKHLLLYDTLPRGYKLGSPITFLHWLYSDKLKVS